MSEAILELFGNYTKDEQVNWSETAANQHCPYLDRKCLKVRKSQPSISIGTCSAYHGTKAAQGIVICPFRFLERRQIFMDCIHLLTHHEPGNELHRVAEVEIPGGNVDYFLVSVRDNRVVDFVGIELQALDTTGSLWPKRQEFLADKGILVEPEEAKNFGINWKMTAKTTLPQLHHKVETFEAVNKHLVLVLQDALLGYMRVMFNFGHITEAKLGDAMHFYAYGLQKREKGFNLQLVSRCSTDAAGVQTALGLQASARIELQVILDALQKKLSPATLLTV